MYSNAALQNQIGKLDQQQAAEYSDIERRRSGINSAYESDVANANADIDAQSMSNYIDAMKTVQAQRIADNAAKGLTSTGDLTIEGRNAQNTELERQAALVAAANYADIDAEIQRRATIDPNDPLIPYLQAARQQKIRDQQTTQAAAQQEARDNAMALWKATGMASAEVAQILGVPVGAKTADYDLGSMNANTSRMNAQTAQTNASKPDTSSNSLYNSTYNRALTMSKDPNYTENDIISMLQNTQGLTPQQKADIANSLSLE